MSIKKLGPYQIEKGLGRGGMGTVYAGVDRRNGQRVAIKVLLANFADDDLFRGRFATEIETLKRLKHPNIVEILGYGEEEGNLFFSMELVQGRSLFDELKSGRRFSWREVVRIGLDVCAALRHAHDRGVVHRDLKPGNLLLAPDGTVKLTDFGIAKLFGVDHLTAVGGVLGTVDYMSPEQAQGKPITIRSDLYSLGSVLYALLARRPPFTAKSLPETLKNLTYEKPPPLASVAPKTPTELAALVDRLLEKDPDKRVGTAQSLSKRLKAILVEIEDDHSAQRKSAAADDDFVVADGPPDPNRTDVPATLGSVEATSEIPIDRSGSSIDADGPTVIPPTIVESSSVAKASEARDVAAQPPAVPASRFKMVDETERRQAEHIDAAEPPSGPIWPYALALLVVAALGVVGFLYGTAPKSAKSLYSEISAAAEGGVEEMASSEEEMREFIQRFSGDPRVEEVRQYLDYVEQTQFARRLQRRVRLRGASSLSPAERDYLDALRSEETDPESALHKFRLLIAVYGQLPAASETTRRCVESAQHRLDQLAKSAEEHIARHREVIRQALTRADELAGSDTPSAITLLDAILDRYADKAWAEEVVDEARAKLTKLTLATADRQP